MRSDTFGRLLKAGIGSIATCEGKTAPVVEDDLGVQIGVTAASIQRYKSGHLPPEQRTVAILAEAAVRRGYLNREWLRNFLQAARYPTPEKLLDELCPAGPARVRPARVYQNLPAPTYSQFVMRMQPFAEVLDGLGQRSALVLIASLGGMGKTSLAREIAAHCLRPEGEAPRFDAAVWVSDKDRPGTTNLSGVLDEIARTLDYPGFIQFEHEEKRREVEQLLRRQKVLLVVDNFETIGDGALLAWLLRLPEPSKAIVTSREYSRAFRNNTYVVDLRGMREAEAQAFIGQRLRFLKIERLLSDAAQLDPLIAATGGNPKAIEVALGLVKHERRPLQQVVDDLYAARGDLFDDLFTRAWALLDEAMRRVLLSMPLFVDSASEEALAATADVQNFAFDRAVERLIDLALLDVQQEDLNSAPRYMLHPLVRAFAGARLAEQSGFEAVARERWIEWYIHFVSKVGYCWEDYNKLDLLDSEQDTIWTVITWTVQVQQDTATIQMAKGISYYFYIRGLWEQHREVYRMHLEAARRLNDCEGEAMSLAFLGQDLSRLGQVAEAEEYLNQLSILEHAQQLSIEALFEFQHALALYWMARRDLDQVQSARQRGLEVAVRLPWIMLNNSYHRLADCLYQRGMVAEASQIFQEALEEAIHAGNPRATAFHQLKLAMIDLDQEQLEMAASRLQQSSAAAYQLQDRSLIAQTLDVYARLHTLRGDLDTARAALAEAIDLFERLGMRHELAEARAELAQLDERAQPTS